MKHYSLLPSCWISFATPFFVGLFSVLLLGACTSVPFVMPAGESNASVTLTVSAAASLQPALEAIAPQFNQAHPDIVAEYNFAASGALQQQIEQGAAADVFFSAATQQMDALEEKALIASESRQDIVSNRLVLIESANAQTKVKNFAQLKSADINGLAVGEFRSVPAGQYARQVFERLDLLGPLQSKFVFGNTVRNVLSAVESGNAELGVVYATDAALSDRVNVIAVAPKNTHTPIVYPIAIVKTSPNPDAAQAFVDFLTTERAQTDFETFGFKAF